MALLRDRLSWQGMDQTYPAPSTCWLIAAITPGERSQSPQQSSAPTKWKKSIWRRIQAGLALPSAHEEMKKKTRQTFETD